AKKPPPSKSKAKPKPKAPSTGSLVAVWANGMKNHNLSLTKSARGKVAGVLKRLWDNSQPGRQAQLVDAIGQWFATKRKDFGIELFEMKINGGDTELLTSRGSTRREIEEYARQLEANGRPEDAKLVRAQLEAAK
ncbi:unnamed protein product, partial [marine sediment metagenome]